MVEEKAKQEISKPVPLLSAKFLLGLILDPKSSELHYITSQKTMILIYSICCRNECASLSISDVDHYVIVIGLCFKNSGGKFERKQDGSQRERIGSYGLDSSGSG
jgi:hypothetical protein